MMSDDSDLEDRSRRRWMTNSAVLVASSLAAAQTNAESESTQTKVVVRETLPKSGGRFCTDKIQTKPIARDEARFPAWNDQLREHAAGRETALVDLNAVDHNLKMVGNALGSQINLRLVAKSLPCLELLEYMMVAAHTNRVMAFSEGMVRDLLLRFGDTVDILLGRPAAVDEARRTFDTLDATGQKPNPAGGVRWLVDTTARMAEFAQLAESRRELISVAVEIDVGLRRGGARSEAELLETLEQIESSPHLHFAGLMGYEGHVPYAAMGQLTPDVEFARVQERYAGFVRTGEEAFPELFAGPQVFNSGGSRTYQYYTDDVDTPVNEVAMGSAFFYPSNFHNIPEKRLRAATFFATPVLKRIDPAETPFDPGFLPRLAAENPGLQVANFMTTGDFPGSLIYPAALIKDPMQPDDTSPPRLINMLPNQGRWLGSPEIPLEVGDFIFYQPWEADAIRWLKYLDVFRGDELVDQWLTFQPGIRL